MGRNLSATDHRSLCWAEAVASVKLAAHADRILTPQEDMIVRMTFSEYVKAEEAAQKSEALLLSE